jgi:hypothetical protein
MFIRVDRGCAHQLRPPLVAKSVDWRAPKGRLTAGGELPSTTRDDAQVVRARNSYCSPDLENQSLEGALSGALDWVTRVRIPDGIRDVVYCRTGTTGRRRLTPPAAEFPSGSDTEGNPLLKSVRRRLSHNPRGV